MTDEVRLPPQLAAVVKKVVDELRPNAGYAYLVSDMLYLAAWRGMHRHQSTVLKMFVMYPDLMNICCEAVNTRGSIVMSLIKISSDVGVDFDMEPFLGDSHHIELRGEDFKWDEHRDDLFVHKFVETLQAYSDKLTAAVEGVPILGDVPGVAEGLVGYLAMNDRN